MLPLRSLKWMVLLVSLVRAAAERPPVLHSNPYPLAQQIFHFTELANNVGDGFANEKPMAGSGNALAAEIELDNLDAVSATVSPQARHSAEAFPPAERRVIDWLLWQEQRRARNQKQAQQQQSLRLVNVALPVIGTQQPALDGQPGQPQGDAAAWETMPEVVDNSYPSEMSDNALVAENVDAIAAGADNRNAGRRAESDSDFVLPNTDNTSRLHAFSAAWNRRNGAFVGGSYTDGLEAADAALRRKRLGYPYLPYAAIQKPPKSRATRPSARGEYKRAKEDIDRKTFLPSISAGAMTHLGDFFQDLSKNIHFTEKSELGHAQTKLLAGDHPLRMLHEKIAGEHEANAELLHAIRTYRPSQKIRSLVAMNPRGYHGSQFIDPNYMWVGLGK